MGNFKYNPSQENLYNESSRVSVSQLQEWRTPASLVLSDSLRLLFSCEMFESKFQRLCTFTCKRFRVHVYQESANFSF